MHLLQSIIRRAEPLIRSAFVRNVSGMLVLTALGQGMYLLVGPLIGRLFSPEQIGLYGLFYTFALTVGGVITLNYDFAVPAPTNDDDARRLTVGAAAIAVVLAPLIGLCFALLSSMNVLGFGALPVWSSVLLTLILWSQAAVQLAQAWRVRRGEILLIGQASVSLNAFRGVSQVVGGFVYASWFSLALGELLGRIVGLIHLIKDDSWRQGLGKHRILDVCPALARHRAFPLILLPAQTVDALVSFAQLAVLSALFGPAAMGQYFLMRRTLDLPVAFVFRSLGDVFYARFVQYMHTAPGEIRPFFTKSFAILLLLGLLVSAPLVLFGPELFTIIFGGSWALAGSLASVMVPAAVLNLAVAPASKIFALTRRPNLRFVFSAVHLVGTIIALAAASWFSTDLYETTIGLAVVISISYLAYFAAGYVAAGTIRLDADLRS